VLLYISILFLVLFGAEEALSENFAIRPSITVQEQYDDNVFSRGEDEDQDEDFVTTLTPEIMIIRERPGFNLDGLYKLFAKFYAKETDLNEVYHHGRLNMDTELSLNTSLSIGDSFYFTPEILEARETEAGIQERRTETISNNAFLTLKHKLTERTFVGVTIRDRIFEYSGSEFIDTRTDSGSLTAGYELTPQRSASITYTYTNFFFDTSDEGEHTETHSVSLGLNEKISPTLSYNISGGVVYTPADTLGDSQVDGIAKADLSKKFQKSSLKLGYIRRIKTGSGISSEVTLSDYAFTSLSFILTSTSNIGLIGGYSMNRSRASGLTDTESYSASIYGNWRLYPWMTLGLRYSRYEQFSVIHNDLTRNRVFLSITATTPTEWRL
jgi:hypothetical protein